MDTSYEERGYLTENFRLFHLKDRPRQEIDWHYHTFHKLILFLSGAGGYAIEGNHYPLQAGDLIFLGRGCIHRPEISADSEYERIILYISPEYLRSLGGGCDLETCFDRAWENFRFVARPGNRFGQIRQLLGELEQIPRQPGFGRELLEQAAFLRLIVTVTRAVEDSRLQYVEACNSDPKITAILQYLQENLTKPLTVDGLAREFAVSKYHMMRRFKESTGSTIHSYLSSKRLILAREKILAGQSAGCVCYECGFRDYSAFSRAYKKLFGVSPRGK